MEQSTIKFIEDDSPLYKERTRHNAEAADITVAFAVDFNTAGEKCTKNVAGKDYVPVVIPPTGGYFRNPKGSPKDTAFLKATAEKIEAGIMQAIEDKDTSALRVKVNIAGNGIYTLNKYGITQEMADRLVLDVIKTIENRPNVHISSIRSGGQTGIDESGIKAAVALGMEAIVLAPKDWKFRGSDGVDISDEQAFKARFLPEYKESETVKDKPVIIDDPVYYVDIAYYHKNEDKIVGDMGYTLGGDMECSETLDPEVAFQMLDSFKKHFREQGYEKGESPLAILKCRMSHSNPSPETIAVRFMATGENPEIPEVVLKAFEDVVDVQKWPIEKKEEAESFRSRVERAIASGKLTKVGELRSGWALATHPSGKVNFVNEDGQFMTKKWFDSATEFNSLGTATVHRDGATMSIDKNGIVQTIQKDIHKGI